VLRRGRMSSCIELAGFAAAQAVCCLFDRMPLLPMAFSRCASGSPTVTILPGGTPDDIAAYGRRWLDANADHADEAVVLCDAYVTIGGVRKHALLIDLRSYREPMTVRMAVPYRPHHDPQGFAVHRPKFIVQALEGQDIAAFTQAFFHGVFSHDPGGRIWNTCADQGW
jgi:hypothetical protein